MNDEIQLKIIGLVYNQSVVGTYGLVLSEELGNKRFSVMIGEPEAQSIALKLNNKISARPLTHDLIKNILLSLDAELKKVLIYDMINDVFYSELYLERSGGDQIIVDARTSDAVALAVRCDCPIYIKSEILDIVGTEVDTNDEPHTKQQQEKNTNLDTVREADLVILTLTELDELLERAVKEERYELAVMIRDVIQKLK